MLLQTPLKEPHQLPKKQPQQINQLQSEPSRIRPQLLPIRQNLRTLHIYHQRQQLLPSKNQLIQKLRLHQSQLSLLLLSLELISLLLNQPRLKQQRSQQLNLLLSQLQQKLLPLKLLLLSQVPQNQLLSQ